MTLKASDANKLATKLGKGHEIFVGDVIIQKTKEILNALTPDNVALMVKKYKEISFSGHDERIHAAANVLFEKAVQDFDSMQKYEDFVHSYCKKTSSSTPRTFYDFITELCSQELGTRIVLRSNGTMEKVEENWARNRRVGIVRFLGALYNCRDVQQRHVQVIAECLGRLLACPSDDNLQDVCELLTMIGKKLEEQLKLLSKTVKIAQSGVNRNVTMPKFILPDDWLSNMFQGLERFSKDQSLSIKTRTDLRNLIRFKEEGWVRLTDGGGASSSNHNHPTVNDSNGPVPLKSSQSVFPLPLPQPQPQPQPAVPVGSMSSWSSSSSISKIKGGPSSIRSNHSSSSKQSESFEKFANLQQLDLSKMKPECALVEILKTLNPGNVPAVSLKIVNLPFEDNYECIYSMTRNMLEKSEKDPSFLENLQMPMDKGPELQQSIETHIKKTDRASSPLFPHPEGHDKETQTLFVAAEEEAEVMIHQTHVMLDSPISHTTDTVEVVAKESSYGVPCKLPPFPKKTKNKNSKVKMGINTVEHQENLVTTSDPRARISKPLENIALFDNDSISNMNLVMRTTEPETLTFPPPGLKYPSMYSNYDRMLQQLPAELAEDLNMEISTLIYQRLKHYKGQGATYRV